MVTSLLLSEKLPGLLKIGDVKNMGAKIIDGEPQASVAMVFGELTDNLNCGIFSCTKGVFSFVYPFNEMATLHEGSVKITDVKTGNVVEYLKGDTWFAEKGTEVLLEVTSQRFVKIYMTCIGS